MKSLTVIYDSETKDIEIVKINEDIDEYMSKEVYPYKPDAKYFFEENLSKTKPTIKTGAEIPFSKIFYKYSKSTNSNELKDRFMSIEASLNERISRLFK